MCFPIMYGGNLVGTLLSLLLSGGQAVNGINAYLTASGPLKLIFVVGMAPLLEEYVFRKQLIDRCGRYGEGTAILFSALAFALFHMNLFQFFYTFGLGLIFGYVYTRAGRLRYPVLLHAAVNFMGSVVAPWVLERVDLEAVKRMSAGVVDESALNGLALLGGYLILLLAIVGIALAVSKRKTHRTKAALVCSLIGLAVSVGNHRIWRDVERYPDCQRRLRNELL